jgi:alkanesulfonate monooxygenase SsuD/methylene tetrahydromethanopterin reductase-like flavin-dependent oxidoreductase (luciferase family)
MEFGLFMMPLHPPRRSYADSYDRDIELIVQADRLGYHEAWIGEHITETWENAPVPELLIAQALALTEKIVLATGVTMLPIHHPVDTAHRIAMLDHMARGRFYWGIGVRSLPTDLQLYGVEYTSMDDVRDQGREALEVILGLWAAEDGRFGFEGKYYQVHAPEDAIELGRRLYYKPYQLPHPPIGVAATGPSSDTIRMAGENGWIPMSSSILMPHHLRSHWEKVEEGAASAGRRADRSEWRIARDVYVGETPESAREGARIVLGQPWEEHQWRNRKAGGLLATQKMDPSMSDEAVDVEYMMENSWIVGDPQECADKIRRLYQDVGGFGHLLVITHDPDDHSLMQNSIRLLKEEVGPRLEDLG